SGHGSSRWMKRIPRNQQPPPLAKNTLISRAS
ncbi:MAG: hypothetical protein ACI9HK_000107, partial [Pirellulaceae bacterium]